MVAPVLTPTAEVVYAWLGQALTGPDAEHGHALAWVVQATTRPLEEVEQVARGRDGRVGWQIALDPDNAPAELLPWLAQWVGESFPDTLSETDRRARILSPSGWFRGTPRNIRRQIREQLTGSKVVDLTERYTGDPFLVEVRVYASQAPDPAAVEAAVVASLPAGIDYVLTLLAGQTWDDLQAAYATWDDVTAAYATWDDLLEDV